MEIENDPDIDAKIKFLAKSQNIDMFLSHMKRAMELEVIIPNQEMSRVFVETRRDQIQKLYLDALTLYESARDDDITLAKEKLKVYKRFESLLGQDYCQHLGPDQPQVSQKTIKAVTTELEQMEQRPPMTDYEALFFTYHYAGATSQRTEGGILAKSMVENYCQYCNNNPENVTFELIRIYEQINAQAASREKVIRKKDQIVMMQDARKAHSEIKNKGFFAGFFSRKSTYPELLEQQIPGKEALEDSRQGHLATYKHMLQLNIVPDAVSTLTKLLANGLERYQKEHGLHDKQPEEIDKKTEELYGSLQDIQEKLVEIKLNEAEEAEIIRGAQVKRFG